MVTDFRRGLVWPLLAAAGLLIGCQAQDDTLGPVDGTGGTGGTGGGSGGGLENQDSIVSTALGSTEFMNEILADIGPLIEGNFSELSFGVPTGTGRSARSGEEMEWDQAEAAWILDVHESDSGPEGDFSASLFVRVQFVSATGDPQYLPDDETETVTMHVDLATEIAAEDEGSTIDMAIDYVYDFTVGGLPNGPHPVAADCTLAADMQWSDGGQPILDFAVEMDVRMDAEVPANEGCPTGLVTVDVQDNQSSQASLVATYDGTNQMEWELYENGVSLESGTELVPCQESPAF